MGFECVTVGSVGAYIKHIQHITEDKNNIIKILHDNYSRTYKNSISLLKKLNNEQDSKKRQVNCIVKLVF